MAGLAVGALAGAAAYYLTYLLFLGYVVLYGHVPGGSSGDMPAIIRQTGQFLSHGFSAPAGLSFFGALTALTVWPIIYYGVPSPEPRSGK